MTSTTLQEATEKLGNAILAGRYDAKSPEWRKLRSGANIGGSEVGTICGLNPWESPFTLWAKKTGQIPSDIEPNESMEWGNLLEPVVIQKFASEHPEFDVIAQPGTYVNQRHTWQIANPDGIAIDRKTGEHVVIEVKTAKYEDDWRVPPQGQMGTAADIPPYYATQVQWYLQIFGFKRAILSALFSGSKYREFEILADKFEQDTNLTRVMHWRELYLLRGEKPSYDGSLSTYETIREIHPDIDPELDIELGDLGMHYSLALAEYEVAEKNMLSLKSEVLDAMGKARRGFSHDIHIVTRQARSGGKPYLINKKG